MTGPTGSLNVPSRATVREWSWLPCGNVPFGLVFWLIANSVIARGDERELEHGGLDGAARANFRAAKRELLDLHRLERIGQRVDADGIGPRIGHVKEATIGAERCTSTARLPWSAKLPTKVNRPLAS